MNNWFLTTIRYTKQLENGSFKRVNEKFLFAATSFTDAEARIYEELGQVIRGELLVQRIERKQFTDIFFYDDADEIWLVKIEYESIDADTDKKKKEKHSFLITAHTAKEAAERIKESLSTLMIDFRVSSVSESKIMEVFPYKTDGLNDLLEIEDGTNTSSESPKEEE